MVGFVHGSLFLKGVLKWFGLDNKTAQNNVDLKKKNSLKQLTFNSPNTKSYYRSDTCVCDLGALFSGGLIFGRACNRNFTLTPIIAGYDMCITSFLVML